jgi:hypothetical protein
MVALAVGALLIGSNGVKGADPATAPAKTEASRKVTCSIAPSKLEFKDGEPILISVAMRNLSDGPVNVAFWGQTNEYPIVNFRIHGAGGKVLLVSTKQNLWCGTGVENRPLPRDMERKVSVDLLKTWEWGGVPTKLPTGDYTISAELFSTTPDGGSPKVAESAQTQFKVVADR